MPFDPQDEGGDAVPGLSLHTGAESSGRKLSLDRRIHRSSTCTHRTILTAVIEKMADLGDSDRLTHCHRGGYNFHPATGDLTKPTRTSRPTSPPGSSRHHLGLVTEAPRRRSRGIEPFTGMSRQHLGNGPYGGEGLHGSPDSGIQELGEIDSRQRSISNSMVDRITPVTTDEDRAQISERHVEDAWPVVCEPF